MTNAVSVVVITHHARTALARLTVMLQLITVAPAIAILQTTVQRTVMVTSAEMLRLMNAAYAVVITHHALTVQEHRMVMHLQTVQVLARHLAT